MSINAKVILSIYIGIVVIISFCLSYRNTCSISSCITGTAIKRTGTKINKYAVEIDNDKSYVLANSIHSYKSRRYVEESANQQEWLTKRFIDNDEYIL